MKQLIYRSQPFGFDRAMLAGILSGARRNNHRDDITGALICRHDLYLQLVEGPAAAIDDLYARILVDDRHCDVELLLTRTTDDRLFAHWAMLDDQSPSLLGAGDSPGEAVTALDEPALLAIFERLSATAAQERAAADVVPG